MSLEAALARISQIDAFIAGKTASPSAATGGAALAPANPSTTSPTVSTEFTNALQSAMAPSTVQSTISPAFLQSPTATLPVGTSTTGAGQQLVQIAQSQIGQTEQPPGSNDSPAIAQYRTATQGAMAGEPWCAYFASWVARQAGEPLGDQGQGFGYVGDIWNWAQQNGRAIPNGPGVVPQPGDLIVFGDHHVGIVDQVLPNGNIETIEGNYNNQVSQVIRGPREATGYVQM